MRRILIDQARRKLRTKHGGGRDRVDLDELTVPARDDRAADLLALDEVLTAFTREEPEKAELVKLRYFAGLTLEEAAACLGISPATAKRHWALARAWLFAALTDPPGPSD
jgi:RNA polymerase sigma factor (TIGR02999 family)